MAINGLMNRYLASRGLKRKGESVDDILPLIPFVIMDKAYEIFNDNIKKQKTGEFRQMMNERRGIFSINYHQFNMSLFSLFNNDEKIELTDVMDEFGEHVKKNIECTFWQFTNIPKDESMERQKILAHSLVIDLLTQCSIHIWEEIYGKQGYGYVQLLNCRKANSEWKDIYYGKGKERVDCNNNEVLSREVSIFCKKLVDFAINYNKC